ncbi:alcohol dehydrogenase [Pullulanibacillus camelliae]|uniref:Alcohol dehydrogenase n=1 Tax=Pullulanibacillus camelliae TaxID=1707096 RepID=A0A8J2YBC6_9BACL|nr:alcohol dehydrogenase catalytic domain-containing protein [Pullulanibacillus camelliae]GGE27583.1 alcohol dehydrogenase [Pullulanibacillus camelliae]
MKCARLYGKEDIRIDEVPIPAIGEHELLIKVEAASICGTDIRMYRNGYGGIDENHPLILGHELAGIISKKGSAVDEKYQIGQPVAVAPNMGCGTCERCISGHTHLCDEYKALGINMDGAFAEYVRIPEKAVIQGNVMVIHNKHNVSFEEIALIEPLSCVYNGQQRLDIGPGDHVLIIGGGPIGVMHAILAKAQGASNVYLYDRHIERLEAAKEIEPEIQTISVKDNIDDKVLALTNNKGMDVVIVAAPAPDIQSKCLEWMNMNGRISYFGGIPKEKEMVPVNSNLIHYKQLLLTGSTRASLLHFLKSLEIITQRLFKLDKLISNRYSIDNFKMAFEQAKSSKDFKSVIVFD